MFKRHVLPSALSDETAFGRFFRMGYVWGTMDIFIFGDESGVFDARHNDLFVFGGLLFLGKEEKDVATRKFLAAERAIKGQYDLSKTQGELKGCLLSNKHKAGLFRSLAGYRRYAFLIDQTRVHERVFD